MPDTNDTNQIEQGPSFAEDIFNALKPHPLKASQDGEAQAAIQALLDKHTTEIIGAAAELKPFVDPELEALLQLLSDAHIGVSHPEPDGGHPYTLVERVNYYAGHKAAEAAEAAATPGIVDLMDHLTLYDVPLEREGRTLTLVGRVDAYAEIVASAALNEAVQKGVVTDPDAAPADARPEPAVVTVLDEHRVRISNLILRVPGHVLDDKLSGVRGINNHDVDDDDGSVSLTLAHNFPRGKTLADVAAVILAVTGQEVENAPSAAQPLTEG